MPNNAIPNPVARSGYSRALSPEKRKRIDRLYEHYIGFSRDRLLRDALRALVDTLPEETPAGVQHGHMPAVEACSPSNLLAFDEEVDEDVPDKRRILALCGESDAGKTRALLEHYRRTPEMQPFTGPDRIRRNPTLWIKAPSPSTPQRLAFSALQGLGVPVRVNLAENRIWEFLRDELKAHRTRFFVIDEAQDAIETANKIEKIKIANALRNLVQMEDCPVRLILLGVPPLTEFLERKQLFNRRNVIAFERLTFDNEVPTVRIVLRTIICDHATMTFDLIDSDDFARKLSHACAGQIGSVVKFVRASVERAIREDREVVTLADFAAVYAGVAGCRADENVFTVDRWQNLDPVTALRREGDREYIATRAANAASRKARRA